jgi:hypothetical protein
MTKVNVELALTLKMSTGGGFNMFKPSISISDIDIDGDVPGQINRALEVVNEAWVEVENAMSKLVTQADIVENESLLVELGRRMTDMEKQLKTVTDDKAVSW